MEEPPLVVVFRIRTILLRFRWCPDVFCVDVCTGSGSGGLRSKVTFGLWLIIHVISSGLVDSKASTVPGR